MTNPDIGFELEDTRRKLIALRATVGSDTPAGHRCSNLVEQLQHYEKAEGDQRTHLAKSIQQQMEELNKLSSGGSANQ